MNQKDLKAMGPREFEEKLCGLIAKMKWVMPQLDAMLDELPEILKAEREFRPKSAEQAKLLDTPIHRCGLFSNRAQNCLDAKFEGTGLPRKTIRDLTAVTRKELLAIKNFGRKSAREVEEVLAEHGLQLAVPK